MENPFIISREPRDKSFTMRFTDSELSAVKARAKLEGKDMVDLVRDALALYLGQPAKKSPERKGHK